MPQWQAGRLEGLCCFLGGQKATLVWEGLPALPQPRDAHLAQAPAVLAGGGATARLRPGLNPVEPLWSSLKGMELANLAGGGLDDVVAAAARGVQRIRRTHHLAFSFLRHCGLSLW